MSSHEGHVKVRVPDPKKLKKKQRELFGREGEKLIRRYHCKSWATLKGLLSGKVFRDNKIELERI